MKFVQETHIRIKHIQDQHNACLGDLQATYRNIEVFYNRLQRQIRAREKVRRIQRKAFCARGRIRRMIDQIGASVEETQRLLDTEYATFDRQHARCAEFAAHLKQVIDEANEKIRRFSD